MSPQFEKNAPKIEFANNIYWNLRDDLKLKIVDDTGLKFYKITFKNGNTKKVLKQEVLDGTQKEISLNLKAPKLDMFFKSKQIQIVIEAIDSSKWNFLEGNKVTKYYTINIDKKRPEIDVISNSYAIRHGGSAVVVVRAYDENLKDAYLNFNNKERFELIPFYKENYYMAVIAWPVEIKDFSGVNLVAVDKANNFSQARVPLYIRPLKQRRSKIKISDAFIENVSTKVIEQSGQNLPKSLEEIFVKENREIRAKNVEKIEKISREYMNKGFVNGFDLKPFKRLKNSVTAGHFAQERSYYHNGKKIDQAWHLGIDWASVKRADITASNIGTVIFNDYLGIYGNTIIIDHGYGIQSLYAHTSSSSVNVGEKISPNQKIANTGSTGAVLGDHLHFGVLVQGIEVNPLEWMDKNWIKTRITDILKDAKKVIDSK